MEEQTSMMGRQRADSLLRNKIGSDEKYKSLHQSLMIMSQDPAVMLICMIRDAFSIGNCYNRVILIQKISFLQLLHGFKLFHFVHRFQNCFCFCSTTIPSAVRTFGQRLLVLHCYYNGDVAPKFDLVITFDWGVVLTQGQRV